MSHFLVKAKVYHKRFRPKANAFTYRVAYLCAPLSAFATLGNALFSIERPNVFSFYARDHGAMDGSPLEPWMRGILQEHGITAADGDIVLMCHPRMFGFVFNPVSFWFCLDKNSAIRAVLAEVNNTFGERHLYLVAHPDARPILPDDVLTARKVFHVSPFLPVEGQYRFRFRLDAKVAAAFIDYDDADGPMLTTFVQGPRTPLTAGAFWSILWRLPFMTLSVVALIHWQAVKLWLKKARFYRKPTPPSQLLTR